MKLDLFRLGVATVFLAGCAWGLALCALGVLRLLGAAR